MVSEDFEKIGKCFVLHKGHYNDVLKIKDEVILWPENSLSITQQVIGVKYKKSIITESPFMICMYDRRDVFIFREGKWKIPDFQTFGCSFDIIMSDILFLTSSINASILSNDKCESLKNKIKNLYE